MMQYLDRNDKSNWDNEYRAIDCLRRELDKEWFASSWMVPSAVFFARFEPIE